jgi:hypothetical protein
MASIIKVNTIQDATNSNTAMTVDTAGRVLTPARPSFRAQPASEIANQAASADLTFDEVGANDGTSHGCHNIGNHYSTSTGKFTCPVAGVYVFHFCGLSYAENACAVQIQLNAQAVAVGQANVSNDESNYESVNVSAVLNCAEGDLVHAKVTTGNFYGSPDYSHFSGFLLG